jgi:hypothetical protein
MCLSLPGMPGFCTENPSLSAKVRFLICQLPVYTRINRSQFRAIFPLVWGQNTDFREKNANNGGLRRGGREEREDIPSPPDIY